MSADFYTYCTHAQKAGGGVVISPIIFHVRIEARDSRSCSIECGNLAPNGYDDKAKCRLFGVDLGHRNSVSWVRCDRCRSAEETAILKAKGLLP